MKISVSRFWKNRGTTLGLAFFLLFAVAPIVWCLGYALAYSFGLAGLLSAGWTTKYWTQAITSGELPRSFLFSAWVALAAIFLSGVTALGLVLGFRRSLQRGAISSLIYLPMALSGLVAAFLVSRWLSGAGLFSRLACAFGFVRDPQHFPSLVNDSLGWGIIAAHWLLAAPFFTVMMLQIYETEKIGSLRQLATSLGASRWQSLRRVAVPVLLQRSSTNLLLYFIFVLGSFEIPLVVGPQNPLVISMLTRRKFGLFDLAQKPEAFVISVVYTALVLFFLLFIFRKAPAHE
ncbi:MAG: ABC transporter permease subunit [Chthoniobacterales bacterium]|jgi:putative spermidine/putrescine transport system permease protein|nr:ABC transporter permease subunit [Chthoniobacterales bacterium]